MNKNIKKITVAALACLAFCGTTMAAPRHHGGHRPPPIHYHAPTHHYHHHGGHHNDAGWTALGALAVGGIIGGIVSAIAH